MRLATLLSLLLLFCTQSLAQTAPDTITLTTWPPELQGATPDDETLYPYEVLPLLDALTLGYAYRIEKERPAMDFTLAWTPGAYGVYDNRLVEAADLPEDIRLVDITLRADVISEGAAVAVFRLELADLALPPTPEIYEFELDAPAWATLFEETSAAGARALFEAGFTLANLRIERAGFEEFVEEDQDGQIVFVPRFFPPRTGIWIGGDLYPPAPGKRSSGVAKPKKPREGIGRRLPRSTKTKGDETADARDDGEVRSRRRTKGEEPGKDDDEDDDTELLPAALTGLALVGALAYAGGSAGYYGHPEAPFGLTSGVVRSYGGLLVQVAANEGVFGSGEPERLVAKVALFYDALNAPLQPAFGFGIQAAENGDAVDLSPSFSVGGVLNLEQFFFYGGYDVPARGVELSLGINFRRRLR